MAGVRDGPQAVLFACGINSVRSPMAAGLFTQLFGRAIYVGSAGVRKGELDPFAVAVMEEIGLDIAKHQPDDLRGTRRLGGAQLRPDRHAVAGGASQGARADPHAWRSTSNTGRRADPTDVEGNREQRLDAYREVRDQLMAAHPGALSAGGPATSDD